MYRRNRNTPYLARNKIKKTQTTTESPLLNEVILLENSSRIQTGYVNVTVNTALGALPVPDAVVTLYVTDPEGNEEALYHLVTDISGKVPRMAVPVVYDPENPLESSEYFFTTYNLRVQAIGYYTQNIIDLRVFPDITTNFNINLIPVRQGGDEDTGQRTLIIPSSPIDESNV
ncbi:MAG TPA: hypothetical protein PLV23_08885 [Sedimentibacter sp.]|jgi:hypothetical protein|nr:hypothetical protein [Sedimentibacter sp.]HHZ00466.1 hypothetical protein [Tissierellia bacterium]HOW23726.1 hypothetical protein [Sedimentibacter sp.]HRC80609.1 hypothetical protein [Sedimentibacter sp.]